MAFVLLVVYIAAQLAYTLLTRTHPAPSIGGIAWTAFTFIVMLLLAYGKDVTGQQLKNQILRTEAHVTLIDAYLAAAVLVGLALNALLGCWWAEPLTSLVIVYYAVREASHAFLESAPN
ncbi:MAG TPA: cation transporter [bacterium]|nr:cation transporter [bacterium]